VLTILTAQLQVGEWKSYTSLLTPTAIDWTSTHEIYASTEGGILKYDTITDEFEFTNNDDGLDYSDINSMAVNEGNLFYLGGNSPTGTIQVYSTQSGLLKHIEHLNLDKIGKMEISEDKLYAVYYSGMSAGLLEISISESDNPHFEDIYHDFPVSINNITDIDTDEEFIYLTTDGGVFRGRKSDILNFQSSWEVLYSGSDAYQLVLDGANLYLFNSLGVHRLENDEWILKVSMNISRTLDAHHESDESKITFITSTLYREFSLNSQTVQYSYPTPPTTRITCYDKYGDTVVLGMKKRGFLFLNPETGEETSKVPNTMVSNRFHSITVGPDGEIIAHVNDPVGGEPTDRISGIMIVKDDGFSHVLTNMNSDGMYLDDPASSTFTAVRRDWMAGGLGSGGVRWSADGKIMIGIIGVFPSNPVRNGGVIILDPLTLEYSIIDTANGILDGMHGIVDGNPGTGYMSVHQLKNDASGNLWVVNAYSENFNHPLAIRTPEGSWYHVTTPDTASYLPQSVAFDSRKRAWIGFRDYSNNGITYSSGGIKVVNPRNTFEDESDDIWYPVSFTENPPGTSVWDLTFDEMGLLWILTSGGVQGYQTSNHSSYIQLSPVYPVDYFSYIPFRMGDRIISDKMGNKWITSQSDGVRVITESTATWPDDAGFTAENSPLLSNIVYDVAIDDDNGIIYFATDKGISSLRLYYDESIETSSSQLSVTPNPFLPGGEQLIIDGCPPGSKVLILTLSGRVIAELKAQYGGLASTQSVWDGKQKNGDLVGSGIYLITAHLKDGTAATTKVAVIRQ